MKDIEKGKTMKIFFATIIMCIAGVNYAKGGYDVEFIFGDSQNTSPVTTFVKIRKIGVDPDKITDTSHKEGSTIAPRQTFKIKINDRKNENYISPKKLSEFRNNELGEEEYKKFFQYIEFEAEGEIFTFRWAQQSPSCLYIKSDSEKFAWESLVKSAPKKDKKSGVFKHVIELGFRKLSN